MRGQLTAIAALTGLNRDYFPISCQTGRDIPEGLDIYLGIIVAWREMLAE